MCDINQPKGNVVDREGKYLKGNRKTSYKFFYYDCVRRAYYICSNRSENVNSRDNTGIVLWCVVSFIPRVNLFRLNYENVQL